ncbi:hypothetical protein [Candidatus Poriferisodalis sp.]|uniref:hypothetical protein n=1 Tax=Candidatus Poriferisodalis sp. TaxID=3101277 RepID=UPI003B018931
MSTLDGPAMSDADHLALAVENWAKDLGGQLQAMMSNREHAFGHVDVFQNVLTRISESLEALSEEMHQFRAEVPD